VTTDATPARSGRPGASGTGWGRCEEWAGAITSQGYGSIGGGTSKRYAHRVAYETAVGPIPAGTEIDHLCRNRRCVNPDHLEAVSHTENVRRGATGFYGDRCRTGRHAKQPNLRIKANGKRYCAACNREGEARRQAAARTA
jgi:hypothetical protein